MTEQQARATAQEYLRIMDRPYENAWPAVDTIERNRWYVVLMWQGSYEVLTVPCHPGARDDG